ncbi:MAG: hypothetical protein FWC43_02935 [Planctomycetaceae bacterium]|nr:hypothetical protein [Planctomycetaceae bacterium]
MSIVLTYTGTTYAQTRKSATSIPYTWSGQSNSSSPRPNPIRLVQVEQEVPLPGGLNDEPFGLVGDLEFPDIALEEPSPQDFSESDTDSPELDMEEFLREMDNQAVSPGFQDEIEGEVYQEIPPLRITSPTPPQKNGRNQSSRPTFTIPQDISEEDVEGGEKHPDEASIRDWIRQGIDSDNKTIPPLVPPPKPKPPIPDFPKRTPPKESVEPVEPAFPTLPIDEPVARPLDNGKSRTTPTKRYFRDCNVGRDMGFEDQCGSYPIEIAPFAGLFIENPYAPLFDLGGSGVDFFGYQRGCPPVRPYGWLFDNMEVFAGTSGFGLRCDDIEETSFGLHEGINWSGSFSPRFGLAAQLGFRAVQRTIDSTNPQLTPTEWNGNHSQVFITTGLFKRAQSHPLQYGVVYDWMSDDKYRDKQAGEKNLDKFNLGQVRTELSYRFCSGFTWGFRGAFGVTQADMFADADYRARATTQLHGFFEKPFWCGSLAGFSAGGTPKGNAVLSAYYDQPLRDKFSLKAGFTYMLPKNGKEENRAFVDDERSAWEAMISLTFHPHGGAFSKNCNPFRAMFDVAGNGSMIVSHRK